MLLLAWLFVAAGSAAQDPVKKERDKLQGVWVDVTDVLRRWPPVDVDQGLPVLDITSDKVSSRVVVRESGKIVLKDVQAMTFTLDPAKEPKAIDFTLTSGANKGKVVRGIYRVDGDDLIICTPAKPDGPRPGTLVPSLEAERRVLRRSSSEAVKKLVASWETALENLLQHITLPVSRQARPIDPKAGDVVYLDISNQVGVQAPWRKEFIPTLRELRPHLKEQFLAREKQAGAGQVKTALVLRADKDAEVMPLYETAQVGLAEGFPRVFVQVNRVAAPGDPREGRLELVLPHWKRPESFADLTVLVKTLPGINDGNISSLIVQRGTDETAIANLAELEPHLIATREKGEVANQDCVRISAQGRLKIGPLIEVMDACLAAGFPSAPLGPPPDMGRIQKIGPKIAPPDPAAQAKVEKEIKAIYQALYAKPAAGDLASRLRQAGEICDDPAAKYVLLREAADAAGRAGNLPACMDAFDQLGKDYNADIWALKLEKFRNAPGDKAVVEAALKQAGNAAVANRLDYGMRFLKLADIAARQARDQDLIKYVEERRLLFKIPGVDELDPFAPLQSPAPKGERSAAAPAPAKAPADDSIIDLQGMILWYVLPSIIAMIFFLAVLVWWLRRGDRAVHSRLAEVRRGQFQLPAADDPPEPPSQAPDPGPPS
jgi:uncharacterized protein (TIGR03067 family)